MESHITVSIVSHRHNGLVNRLLQDIALYCRPIPALIVTENVRDPEPLSIHTAVHLEVLRNALPKGFGANHNAAFARCQTPFFCVINPDVRLAADPFPRLAEAVADRTSAAVGPLVKDPGGRPEDSARRFPTPAILLRKLFRSHRGPDYPADRGRVEVDWIAGMFMLFRSEAYRAVGGFDERYFMYYEDVDVCARLRLTGKRIVLEPRAPVLHDARRASHRNPLYAFWHVSSILRYLRSTYRELRCAGLA